MILYVDEKFSSAHYEFTNSTRTTEERHLFFNSDLYRHYESSIN